MLYPVCRVSHARLGDKHDIYPTTAATISTFTLLEIPYVELGKDNMEPVDVTSLRILPPCWIPNDPLGIAVRRTGSFACTILDVFLAVTSTAESELTLGECSMLTMPPKDKFIVPKTEPVGKFRVNECYIQNAHPPN